MTLSLALCTDLRYIDQRRARGLDLLVLPELADGGYAALARGDGKHTAGDDYFRRLRSLSHDLDLALVAGSASVQDHGGHATNTCFVFHRGRTVLRYDKLHLFRPTGDHRFFRSGGTARTRTLKLRHGPLRLGVIICFDLRFPELARHLAFQGMDLLVVPARWPAVRAAAWRTLLRARAIENQLFVAGCNASGKEGGPSYLFDPLGRPVPRDRERSTQGWQVYRLELDALVEAKRLYDTRREALLMRGHSLR